jgi:hypothetical protein
MSFLDGCALVNTSMRLGERRVERGAPRSGPSRGGGRHRRNPESSRRGEGALNASTSRRRRASSDVEQLRPGAPRKPRRPPGIGRPARGVRPPAVARSNSFLSKDARAAGPRGADQGARRESMDPVRSLGSAAPPLSSPWLRQLGSERPDPDRRRRDSARRRRETGGRRLLGQRRGRQLRGRRRPLPRRLHRLQRRRLRGLREPAPFTSTMLEQRRLARLRRHPGNVGHFARGAWGAPAYLPDCPKRLKDGGRVPAMDEARRTS